MADENLSHPDDDAMPVADLERIVAVCDRFDKAWRDGQHRRIEDDILEQPEPLRPRLFRELPALELELRRERGEMNNLAQAYVAAGRTAEAIALHEEAFKLMKSKLGPDHPETLVSMNNLATQYLAAGKAAEAEPRRDSAVAVTKGGCYNHLRCVPGGLLTLAPLTAAMESSHGAYRRWLDHAMPRGPEGR